MVFHVNVTKGTVARSCNSANKLHYLTSPKINAINFFFIKCFFFFFLILRMFQCSEYSFGLCFGLSGGTEHFITNLF